MRAITDREFSPTGQATAAPRVVVAVVLAWRGRIGLFKRSAEVAHDAGLWHCVTGYVDPGTPPRQQALLELFEETGLSVVDLSSWTDGPILEIAGDGALWSVHTFSAITEKKRLNLNWEHDCYRWVRPSAVRGFDGQVLWLSTVLDAVASRRAPNGS